MNNRRLFLIIALVLLIVVFGIMYNMREGVKTGTIERVDSIFSLISGQVSTGTQPVDELADITLPVDGSVPEELTRTESNTPDPEPEVFIPQNPSEQPTEEPQPEPVVIEPVIVSFPGSQPQNVPLRPGSIDSEFELTGGNTSGDLNKCFSTTLADLEADYAWVRETDAGYYCVMVFSATAQNGQEYQVVKSYGPGNIRSFDPHIEAIYGESTMEVGQTLIFDTQLTFSDGDIIVGGLMENNEPVQLTLEEAGASFVKGNTTYQNCTVYSSYYADFGLPFGLYNDYFCETQPNLWRWVGRS